jgi:uncharacterized DUF497 family protein
LSGAFFVATIIPAAITFDPLKSDANARSRGLPFSLVSIEFEWSTAFVAEDRRRNYGEQRFQAIGLLADRLHVVVFTPVAGAIRVISLRKANDREVRRYEDKAAQARVDR